MLAVMNNKWFFGLINAQTAENYLSTHSPGTFLVRLNSGETISVLEAPFTISLILEDGRCAHIRALTSKHGGLWGKFLQTKVPAQPNICSLVDKLLEISVVSEVCSGYPFERKKNVLYMNSDEDED